MHTFLTLPPDRQRLIYEQAATRIGILPESVEKDFWVSFILCILFSHERLAPIITFKGGTSLSKAWHLIKRFSEDIDLVIDKKALSNISATDYTNTDKKPSRGQLKKLGEAGKDWVQGFFRKELSDALDNILGNTGWSLEVDPEVEDGMCLLFTYTSVLETTVSRGYIRKVVKIEMGPQPDNWPSVATEIKPMIFEEFPQLSSASSFTVQTIEPRRTLWEKALLLHEITNRANNPAHADKKPRPRLSRHYYDLYCLLGSPFRPDALMDMNLFNSIVNHRKVFFKITGVDYASMSPGSLNILPHPSHKDIWLHDYEQMKETMFYDPNLPTFEEILAVIKRFQDEFNQG